MRTPSSDMPPPSTSRLRGPQPIIDSLESSRNHSDEALESPDIVDRPTTAPHTTDPQPSMIFPNKLDTVEDFRSPERKSSNQQNDSTSPRPGLPRAKSDFGPRREDRAKGDDEESASAADGEWGIRHGFETQLASEEHNNLLTSVSTMTPRTRYC